MKRIVALGKVDFKKLAFWMFITYLAMALGGYFSASAKDVYASLTLPAFAPPPWLFGPVWFVLYTLMGIGAYLVSVSGSRNKSDALAIYLLNLFINITWSLIFFTFGLFFAALVDIVLLIGIVAFMIRAFYIANPVAGYLQIPYILWLCFAAVLNLFIVILN